MQQVQIQKKVNNSSTVDAAAMKLGTIGAQVRALRWVVWGPNRPGVGEERL